MSTLPVAATYLCGLACIIYGFIGIKRGYIVMRMPDGSRIRYDRETNARGFYVSVALFLSMPLVLLLLAYVASLNSN